MKSLFIIVLSCLLSNSTLQAFRAHSTKPSSLEITKATNKIVRQTKHRNWL